MVNIGEAVKHLLPGGMVAVHRLVAWTFLGPQPAGIVVRHIDNDESNCRSDNLAYGTHAQNMLDRRSSRTPCHGEHHALAKNTEQKIADMRALRGSGLSQREVAEKFGVSQSYISMLWNGRRWKHTEKK